MQTLSVELLEQAIMGANDCEVTGEFVTNAPLGYEEKFFEDFLTFLGSKDADEVAGISDDDLIRMLIEGEELFSKISFGTMFGDGFLKTLSAEKSVKTASRRVL